MKPLRCDVCGREVARMPPELEKQRRAEAVSRGVPVEEQRFIVCDPCWDASEAMKAQQPFIRLRKVGKA